MTTKYKRLGHDNAELERMISVMDESRGVLEHHIFTGKPVVDVPVADLDRVLRQHAAMTRSLQEWLRLHIDRPESEEPWAIGYAEACKAHLKSVRERLRNIGILWARPKR